MRRTDRAERLLDLVSFFLAASRPLPWEEIREAFPADYGSGNEASCLRKWERDKAELVELGVPLEWVPGDEDAAGGYRLDRERYYLPRLDLSQEERMLLLFAGSALASLGAFPLRGELLHALDKLVFAASERGEERSVRAALRQPVAAAADAEAAEHLAGLGQALVARKDVSILYRAFDGSQTERRVSPYGVAFRRGAWVLVGHCHLRAAIRTFALERILRLETNTRSPKVPDFEIPPSFRVQDHVGREAWELGLHRPEEVQLLGAAQVAPILRHLFEGRETLEELADGALRLRVRSSNSAALVRLVLQLAPFVELEGPAPLREEVAAVAARIAAAAEGPPVAAPLSPGRAVPLGGGAEAPEMGEGSTLGWREAWEAGASEASPRKRRAGAGDLRERFRRALFLIPYAAAHSGCSVEELAGAARLSPEELLEELNFLRMVGRPPFSPADLVDIDVVEGRVELALPQGLYRPPTFTLLEVVALDAATSALEAEGGEAMLALRRKLRSILPEGTRLAFDDLSGRMQVGSTGIDPETTRIVDTAIQDCVEVEFTYFTAGRGEGARRAVRPLERVLHQGYWYLHAYCCSRRERRLFRLDRASAFKLTERTFVRRSTDGIDFFAGEGRSRRALLRFAPGPSAQPDDLRRLGAEEVQAEEDGSVLALFPLHGEAYLVATALSFAGSAEILEPATLRERMRHLASRLVPLHSR